LFIVDGTRKAAEDQLNNAAEADFVSISSIKNSQGTNLINS